MAKDNLEKLEDLQMVQYRMDAEGFDYCFRQYSRFEEIEDPKFHELRLAYINAAAAIEQYVEEQINKLEEADDN
jgi:hypothetical protein